MFKLKIKYFVCVSFKEIKKGTQGFDGNSHKTHTKEI